MIVKTMMLIAIIVGIISRTRFTTYCSISGAPAVSIQNVSGWYMPKYAPGSQL